MPPWLALWRGRAHDLTPAQAALRMALWAIVAGLLIGSLVAASHQLIFALQQWLEGWGPARR